MSKHTPGPWSIVRNAGSVSKSVVSGRTRVALIRNEDSADARLIAAAPELLSATKSAREVVYEVARNAKDPAVVDSALKFCATLDLIIRRAEGREE